MVFSSSVFWVFKISRRFVACGLAVGVVFHRYLWRFCHSETGTKAEPSRGSCGCNRWIATQQHRFLKAIQPFPGGVCLLHFLIFFLSDFLFMFAVG
jgi:hypothetical protein